MIFSEPFMRKFAASGGVIELASITYIKEARQRPSDMQRVMEYCMQDKKTWDEEAGIRWVSGVNCDGLNAITEFEATKVAWNKEDGIRFYQYVQSFSPTENITYTCPNGKKCRGIKLHEEKYKKEMMEYEFAIREQEIRQFVDDGSGTAQRSGAGGHRPDPVSAHGVRHPGAMAREGNATTGGCSPVSAHAVPADLEFGHTGGTLPNANGSEGADLPITGQARQGCDVPATTGWESEREILYGLIQEALRRSAGSGQRKGEFGKNLPQMGAHRGGRVGGIFDAGLHTLSAIGRLTEDTDEDEEEQRKRMEAQQTGSAVGTALGLAIGALLAIRDEELRKEEATLQEELAEEQNHIWQLSM